MHLTWGYDLVSQVQPGDRVLHWQTRAPRGLVEFPAHPGLTMLAYTAPAGTPTADSLRMLANWAITTEKAGELPAHA